MATAQYLVMEQLKKFDNLKIKDSFDEFVILYLERTCSKSELAVILGKIYMSGKQEILHKYGGAVQIRFSPREYELLFKSKMHIITCWNNFLAQSNMFNLQFLMEEKKKEIQTTINSRSTPSVIIIDEEYTRIVKNTILGLSNKVKRIQKKLDAIQDWRSFQKEVEKLSPS